MTDVAGKCKKRERNKVTCTKYRNESRQERNALRRLFRHVRTHCKIAVLPGNLIYMDLLPSDLAAHAAALQKTLSVIARREVERECGWSFV